MLTKKAKKAGLSAGAFVRMAIAGKEIMEAPPVDLPMLIREVRRVGSNINQLTMLAHMGKIQSPYLESAANLYSRLLTEVKKLNERRRR